MTKKTQRRLRRGKDAAAVVVKGPASQHVFLAPEILDIASLVALRESQQRAADIAFCKGLGAILAKSKPDSFLLRSAEGSAFYRICPASREALDTAGTFAAGGRVNFGMAQRCKELPSFRPTFGLYASMDAVTAEREVTSCGIPLTAYDVLYKIEPPAKPVSLIDYDAAVALLDTAAFGIARIVSETPYYAEWALQKYPKPSQVVGDWLRRGLPADGLIFGSTKQLSGRNVLLFADSASGLGEAGFVATRVKSYPTNEGN